MSARGEGKRKAETPRADDKPAFEEMCRGFMSGEMPGCCREMLQMMMSRWAGAFSASQQP